MSDLKKAQRRYNKALKNVNEAGDTFMEAKRGYELAKKELNDSVVELREAELDVFSPNESS